MGMSDDELQAMEGQAKKLTILELKKNAVAAKQIGDTKLALENLKRAKKIEQEEQLRTECDDEEEEEPSFSSTLPIFWKKVAILCKQAGDIDRAKQALMHSKELEAAALSEASSSSETGTDTNESLSPPPPPPLPPPPPQPSEEPPPPSYENMMDIPPPPPPSYDFAMRDNISSSCVQESIEVVDGKADMIAEVMGGEAGTTRSVVAEVKQPQAAEVNNNENDIIDFGETDFSTSNDHTMTYSVEEMMDEEMMTELAMLGDVPSQEEYASKVLEYKKLALKYKNDGDIPKATQHLRQAKQLEKVASALKNVDGGGDLLNGLNNDRNCGGDNENALMMQMMGTLNAEESELLGELFDNPNGSSGNDDATNMDDLIGTGGGGGTTQKLSIDDLNDMTDDNDVIELVEMMGPDALPSVKDVTNKINDHTSKAISYKKEGNIDMAKHHLIESKKTKLLAMRLGEIYRKLDAKKKKESGGGDDPDNDDDNDVSMDALEALMDGGGVKKNPAPAPAPDSVAPPAVDPWLLKPSSEIKAEVIRLKNEKNVKEATRVLQLFKQRLAQEQEEAEQLKRSKMIAMIEQRLDVCGEQIKLWQYYSWFGAESSTVGIPQYQEWIKFQNFCQKAVSIIDKDGSDSVTISPRNATSSSTNNKTNTPASPPSKKLYTLEDDLVSLVESCTNDNKNNKTPNNNNTNSNYLADNSLEVCVMGMFDMNKNEKLQKILVKQHQSYASKKGSKKKVTAATVMSTPPPDGSAFPPNLSINAKLQLPIHVDDPSKPVFMDFEPSHSAYVPGKPKLSQSSFKYSFDPSSQNSRQSLALPRDDPKHERTLLRRIETKTIQLSVFYSHDQKQTPQQKAAAAAELAKKEAEEAAAAAAKKKSWFFGGGGGKKAAAATPSDDLLSEETGENNSKDTFLGKVIIEFNPLLCRGCITEDYPIMTNAKSLGGILRVSIRTKPVMDPDRYIGVAIKSPLHDDDDDDEPSSSSSSGGPSISVYKKGLSFAFNKKKSEEGKTSIAAIKEEQQQQQQEEKTEKTTTTTTPSSSDDTKAEI